MSFTIAYMTCRREPHVEWFLQSLARQCSDVTQKIIIVDFYADEPGRREKFASFNTGGFQLKHVTPKPSVFQGKHRLTCGNFFDASGSRNTAICLCEDDRIAFIDDLTVLGADWYACAKEAATRAGYTFGSYRKVNNLRVSEGMITGFSDQPNGHDVRRSRSKYIDRPFPCHPDWLFGCSLVVPVESVLQAGGWPEALCGTLGYEDSAFARIVRNRREPTTFDPRMFTYESEEGHHVPGDRFYRVDPCKCNPCTPVRDDKSHAMLRAVESATVIDNGYDIRALRQHVLAGGEFPVPTGPTHEWFTGMALSELKG